MTQDLFSLGSLYVSDFLADGEEPRCPPAELKLQMEDGGAVRLEKVVDPGFMYGRYWYRSGVNQSMKDDLKDVVDSVCKIKEIKFSDVWLDIASNDGTLLSFVPRAYKLGIDPVEDSFVTDALANGADEIVQSYFSAEAYNSSLAAPHGGADVVTCVAMFYDLDEPGPFLDDVRSIMKDDGLFVLQMSYTPLMLDQMAFDNICHEHVYYYTLTTLTDLLNSHGFTVLDCTLNAVNGGSFRVMAIKDGANPELFGSQPFRDVSKFRVEALLSYEDTYRYNDPEIWSCFYRQLQKLKSQVVNTIKGIVNSGGTVAVYGASTKGNTLLQYFGLDNSLISYAVERSPAKFGLRTVGTNIPIVSEETMRADPPTAMLMLPWHFVGEFVKRERDYLAGGGIFIVPMPEFKIITG